MLHVSHAVGINFIKINLHMLTLKVISHVPNVPANSRAFEFWRVFVPMHCRGIVSSFMTMFTFTFM